ncbi:hypothetical protein RFI_38952 [Reticulomyxa filosa]|uniref:Uncharacterized protein n=1 Tax=Reticulomyxa filosa TaxID=46433 RepID=X6L928_RETFI|nr:hypothetical protein RFI_38952 [Reticulomyxa filosa]|eukprot:ETN98542.1 hypothetical protein RFI_38952 [Reticulomyxa filosa]
MGISTSHNNEVLQKRESSDNTHLLNTRQAEPLTLYLTEISTEYSRVQHNKDAVGFGICTLPDKLSMATTRHEVIKMQIDKRYNQKEVSAYWCVVSRGVHESGTGSKKGNDFFQEVPLDQYIDTKEPNEYAFFFYDLILTLVDRHSNSCLHVTWRVVNYSSTNRKLFLFSPKCEHLLIFESICIFITLPLIPTSYFLCMYIYYIYIYVYIYTYTYTYILYSFISQNKQTNQINIKMKFLYLFWFVCLF